jgi:hypothetical protein
MPARRAFTDPPKLDSVACGFAISIGICPERSRYQPIKGHCHKRRYGAEEEEELDRQPAF